VRFVCLFVIYFLLLFSERIRAPVQLSEEEVDRRALLFKEYAKYRNAEDIEVCVYLLFIYYYLQIRRSLQRRMDAQTKALHKLKQLNPVLYEAAIEVLRYLIVFECFIFILYRLTRVIYHWNLMDQHTRHRFVATTHRMVIGRIRQRSGCEMLFL
jgi:hypothetical protein